MWCWKKPSRIIGLSVLVLIAAGCTVSIQPWTKPTAPAPNDLPPGHPNAPANFIGPVPRALPPGMTAPNANEATSQLVQKLNDSEDQRRALENQLSTLKKQVKDREESLQQASYAVADSSKDLRRTREEFRQWQTEMDELRDRLRKLEDYRATLKPLIEEILHQLDHDREAPKTLRVPAASK
jgi:hypothetical protein